MSVVETVGERIADFLGTSQSNQANSRILYYRAELNGSANTFRTEYNDRAETLRSNLTKKLTHSRHFTTVHPDRTIDPHIALGTSHPNLPLTDHDERIYDLAERAKQRRPWPEGTEYDVGELLADFSTPRAAQSARKHIVTYEVTVRGRYNPNREWGSPAALENTRRLMAEFAAETADVESIERFRPVEDGWYSFRHWDDEIRVRATVKAERPYIEWTVGHTVGCPRGLGWVGVVNDDQYGNANGRLYLGERSNDPAQEYFEETLDSIAMPERIAESLLEDAHAVEPDHPY